MTDLARIFHSTPQRVPPPLVRDLTLGQMGLLFRLQRNGPMTMGDIAGVFDMSTTASSGFVSRVERHGLVARHHSSADRRIVECRLTEAGERLVGEISGRPVGRHAPGHRHARWFGAHRLRLARRDHPGAGQQRMEQPA